MRELDVVTLRGTVVDLMPHGEAIIEIVEPNGHGHFVTLPTATLEKDRSDDLSRSYARKLDRSGPASLRPPLIERDSDGNLALVRLWECEVCKSIDIGTRTRHMGAGTDCLGEMRLVEFVPRAPFHAGESRQEEDTERCPDCKSDDRAKRNKMVTGIDAALGGMMGVVPEGVQHPCNHPWHSA